MYFDNSSEYQRHLNRMSSSVAVLWAIIPVDTRVEVVKHRNWHKLFDEVRHSRNDIDIMMCLCLDIMYQIMLTQEKEDLVSKNEA
jgi:hypothetical protein